MYMKIINDMFGVLLQLFRFQIQTFKTSKYFCQDKINTLIKCFSDMNILSEDDNWKLILTADICRAISHPGSRLAGTRSPCSPCSRALCSIGSWAVFCVRHTRQSVHSSTVTLLHPVHYKLDPSPHPRKHQIIIIKIWRIRLTSLIKPRNI